MKQFIILLFASILCSCTEDFSCDEWANSFRDDKEIKLILREKSNNLSRDAYLKGIEINTGNPVEFYDGSGWIAQVFDKFQIGDTIIKPKGKYTILIRRKTGKILIPFVCTDTKNGEKTYKDL